jgi:hypothetical protein
MTPAAMAIDCQEGGASLIDVLDRVLDKGIVVDAWVRVSLVAIDLVTVEARVVVASVDTRLKYSDAAEALAASARTIFDLVPTDPAPPAIAVALDRRRRPLRVNAFSKHV